ncbi:MAG: hypothetical protein ACM31C_32970 [Acidobacteriota bacterium]
MRGTSRGLLVVVGLVVACGPPSRNSPDGGGSHGSGGDANDNSSGCSDAAKAVYVIDQLSNHLSRFDPATKTFADLGQLHCATAFGAQPFSMGVDRTATAWVLYDSGELFQVDIASLACTKTSWTTQQGLKVFGMGFSTDTPGGTTDSLFVGGGMTREQSPVTVARLDTQTMTAMPIGSAAQVPEMTGTGNAQLWGFMAEPTTSHVIEIDKTNGSILQSFPEPTLAGTDAGYAFAFWGGDFWVFFIHSGDAESKVYQVDGHTGAIKGTTSSMGRTIVGAGVSTCAPVVIQ